MNDEERLAEIATIKARMEADRARLLTLIKDAFPENRGEAPIRGRLTAVVKASGWTRDYVAQIRDGKVRAPESEGD